MSPLPSDTRSMLQKGNVMSKHYHLIPMSENKKKIQRKKTSEIFLKYILFLSWLHRNLHAHIVYPP